jgi:hypothetical protein
MLFSALPHCIPQSTRKYVNLIYLQILHNLYTMFPIN